MKEVKVCGLTRPADIEGVNIARPDYCGFIINYPKSPRSLSARDVVSLLGKLNPAIVPVGVFVDQPLEVVASVLNSSGISVAQLHGQEDEAYIRRLRLLTDKPIWKAFEIQGQADIIRAAKSTADFLLLDAGKGGGIAFDWGLIDGFQRPFGLAGGLNLENLPKALRTRASLLDISSGVETGGVKDPEKIRSFIKTATSSGEKTSL